VASDPATREHPRRWVHTDHADQVQVRRAYKFLLRPTSKQAGLLVTALEDHRQLYNAALDERREAWRMRRVPIGYCAQARQLAEIRHTDNCGQGRWSAGSQQQNAPPPRLGVCGVLPPRESWEETRLPAL
jgi:Helix-turn-helix domain